MLEQPGELKQDSHQAKAWWEAGKNIQVKILLSKAQFNIPFTSLGPRKLYQIAVHSQNPLLGFWKLSASTSFIFQMLLWQEKATFYIRLRVKSGHWPWKRNSEHSFLFVSYVCFCNFLVHFLTENVKFVPESHPKKSFLQGRSKWFMSARCRFVFLQIRYRQAGSLGESPCHF